MMQQPGITEQFADFVLSMGYDDLPAAIVEQAKNGILDFIGVALLGSRESSTRMVLRSSGFPRISGNSTVLGSSTRASPTVAALANAYAAHAMDYDDTQHDCGTHMSSPVLGAALVAAEMGRCSGKELLTAYVVGFEIGCRLGHVARFGDFLLREGIHGTGFLGHFGAVAAAGKLIGLTPGQMRHAFGIAATQAAGLVNSFGSMAKPLHAANAAHNGLRSALLAKEGFTGPESIFDGEKNIFSIHRGSTDPEALICNLGKEFEISGNTFKAFACSGGRNPVVEAVMHIAAAQNLQPIQVASIHVWLWSHMIKTPNYPKPRTGLESKFSTEHAAVVALVDRAGGVQQFSDERVADPALAALRRKVTVQAGRDLGQYQVRLLVRTTDGKEYSHFIPAQKGDPRNPLSREELVAKCVANASTVVPLGNVEAIVSMIQDIESVRDVGELCELCRAGLDIGGATA